MSSILTNTGAMTALATLRATNHNLAKTQDEISTGKSVATAKDNAAVWAIAKTMESDVRGFQAISDSLGLGEETVAVARKAAESVEDLLDKMKAKVVASQEANVPREKYQTDIDALKKQINSVVSAAQFNGLNLLSNTDKKVGSGSIDVLSSLDRSGTTVSASQINVQKQDLGTRESNVSGTALAAADDRVTGTIATAATAIAGVVAPAAPGSQTLTIDSTATGFGYSIAVTASGGNVDAGFNTAGNLNTISYVARDGDTAEDVAQGLAKAFNDHVAKTLEGTGATDAEKAAMASIKATVSGSAVTFTGAVGAAGDTFSLQATSYAAAGNTIGGALKDVNDIDVRTDSGAKRALADIESMIKMSIDAAAELGSAQGRIEIQAEFISGLTDSLKAGIGTLVDADMEETSARLQALQVQQQLGVQALSIANQAPQSVLSLFR